MIREPSKVVSLIIEDTQANEQSISQIIATYKHQFQQESVLQVVDEEIGVAFGSVPVPIEMQRSYSASDHGSSDRMINSSNPLLKGNLSLDRFAYLPIGKAQTESYAENLNQAPFMLGESTSWIRSSGHQPLPLFSDMATAIVNLG